jgi:hypothetical protein
VRCLFGTDFARDFRLSSEFPLLVLEGRLLFVEAILFKGFVSISDFWPLDSLDPLVGRSLPEAAS